MAPLAPPEKRPRTLAERVVRVGTPISVWADLYHFLLVSKWRHLFGLIFVSYVALNVLFATAYWLMPESLENANGSFADAFFFSVQTMATIGYGKMTPRSVGANVLVTVEALVGLIGTAMATGLMFAKFSRPTSRVMFTKNLVVSKRDGVPTLVLRMANARANQIVEAQLRLSMLVNAQTAEGERMRRSIELKLVRERTAVFVMSWTVMHVIDETSPLHGMTTERLAELEVEIMASLVGTDETFAQTVHARHLYYHDEIVFGARFADMMTRTPDSRVILDYSKFDELLPAA